MTPPARTPEPSHYAPENILQPCDPDNALDLAHYARVMRLVVRHAPFTDDREMREAESLRGHVKKPTIERSKQCEACANDLRAIDPDWRGIAHGRGCKLPGEVARRRAMIHALHARGHTQITIAVTMGLTRWCVMMHMRTFLAGAA